MHTSIHKGLMEKIRKVRTVILLSFCFLFRKCRGKWNGKSLKSICMEILSL